MACFVLDVPSLALASADLPPDQVLGGTPATASAEIPLGVPALDHLEVGVWEHTAGASSDVEADEVFIVLSGRATVVVTDGPTLDLAPGTLGVLEAGAATTWTVHETLRKVYVTPR
jgi:uncharacterized cupin superfamily protein